MIHCTLDGKVAYPSSSEKIKITLNNPYVQDSGTYTYDISFPMSIHQNAVVFNNIHRLDVRKRISSFETCELYADNKLIISGKGTVTSVNNTTVKLQIVGGASRIKFNSKFEKHFIDEIDYPSPIITKGINREHYNKAGLLKVPVYSTRDVVMVDLTDYNMIGNPGVVAFNPIFDETRGYTSNLIDKIKADKASVNGITYKKKELAVMSYLAVQPYLLYVLNQVLLYEGYTIIRNDFYCEPWNRLIVASARRTVCIKRSLPHWSVYTFIEEVQKLLNARFIFDEVKKTVSILPFSEVTSNSTITYECLDEFSSEYDEDGVKNLSTSNIEYEFDQSTARDWRDCIPISVFREFTTKEYPSVDDMLTAANKMMTKERRTTIFKVGCDYYVWAILSDKTGSLEPIGKPGSAINTEQCVLCGLFSPVIRDTESDDSIALKISPAAITTGKRYKSIYGFSLFSQIANVDVCLASVPNSDDVAIGDTSPIDGDAYLSVQDAMEGSDIESNDAEPDEGQLPVMFQGVNVVNIVKRQTCSYSSRLENEDTLARFPITLTDYRRFPDWVGSGETASLSLNILPRRGYRDEEGKWHFGSWGAGPAVGYDTKINIDTHNLHNIKFITDEIPDPSKIYIFRNQKFICQKIEVEVADGSVNRVKTGYFYKCL